MEGKKKGETREDRGQQEEEMMRRKKEETRLKEELVPYISSKIRKKF